MARYEAIQNIEMASSPSKSMLPRPTQYEVVENIDMPSDTSLIPDRPPLSLNSPSESSPQPVLRARHSFWWQRIGLSGLLILIVGTIVMLGSCGVLIFLWAGTSAAENRNESDFWQLIVVRGWTSRVVTICSAAIRTSMGLHIGLIAAATAAIMLETTGVLLVDAPVLSIARAAGPSPLNILPATIRRCITGRGSGVLYLLIIAMAFILSLLSNFTSTMLLSDFDTVQVQMPPTARNIPIDSNKTEQFWNTTSYWRYQPSAQWRFAEAKPKKGHVGDTQNTYRAMLPFSNAESRTSLEYYSGPAIVTDFRTECQPLGIKSVSFEQKEGKLHISIVQGEGTFYGETGTIEALLVSCLSSSTTWPLALYSETEEVRSNTYVAGADDPGIEGLKWTRVFLFNSIFLQQKNSTRTWNNMLKNSTGITHQSGGFWTEIFDPHGSSIVNITTCYVNVAVPQIHRVNISGLTVQAEPDGDWRNESATEAILSQFGVGSRSSDFNQRGILRLDMNISLPADVPDDDRTNLLLNRSLSDSSSSSVGSWTLSDDLNSLPCFEDWSVHAIHVAVFQGIIQETHDPALAVQVLMTRLYQMAYYDMLPYFNIEHSVTIIHATSALVPARWTGLGIVLGLVSMHFALLLAATLLFATQTKSSMLGNAWQAVAQMVSPQTREIVESADRMRDEEVDQWIRARGRAEVCHVSISGERERIEVNRCERR